MEIVPRETQLAFAQKGRRFRMGIREKAAESGLKTGKISTESPICCPVTWRCTPATKALLC
jgi:hypothetical protein